MEIGIGTQRANAATPMYKEVNQSKKQIEGFSQHLLGYVSNQSSGLKEVKEEDSLSFLVNLEAILGTNEMEDLNLTSEQLDELSKVKELDVSQIADIIGVNAETIKTLFSDLSSALLGTIPAATSAEGEDVYENLLGTLQLLQSALTQDLKGLKTEVENTLQGLNSQGHIEDAIKLAKVMELFARNRDMHVTDASKASELKDMVKNIQTGIDGALSKIVQPSGDWSRILREAYTRRQPEETTEKNLNNPSVDASPADKKSIQTVQGTNLHFVLPKTENFSMSLTSGSRSIQYEQFVKEFQNILGKSNMLAQPNMSKLLIKLYPERLGSLRIELLQQNGIMTAKILASTTTAKEMLDSQIQGLKHAFTSQNLNVEKIEISQTLSDTERQYKGQSQQQSQQQKQEQSDQPGVAKEEGNQSFKDYLVNTEI
jgi:flagellar hook-length control protein FliK